MQFLQILLDHLGHHVFLLSVETLKENFDNLTSVIPFAIINADEKFNSWFKIHQRLTADNTAKVLEIDFSECFKN